jgi:hypothetical protein
MSQTQSTGCGKLFADSIKHWDRAELCPTVWASAPVDTVAVRFQTTRENLKGLAVLFHKPKSVVE